MEEAFLHQKHKSMKIEKLKQGDKNKIEEFKRTLSFCLPEDYLAFLAEYDGAVIKDGYFPIMGTKEFGLMDVLYGLDVEKALNVRNVNKEYEDDILEQSILIGEDPGGAFILLVNGDNGECNGFKNGIYLYDHQYSLKSSDDDNNTYFICNSFSEFLNILETTEFNS